MTKIFISYRREDSKSFTHRLCDSLRAHFDEDSVFIDVDSIPYGVDFRSHLKRELSECDAVLVVIGNKWLQADSNGVRRLDDSQDFVRIEVETALENDVPVIPITIDDASVPGEHDLPDTLQPLAYRNACPVDTGVDFHHHVDRLITNLTALIPTSQPESPADKSPNLSRPEGRLPATRSGFRFAWLSFSVIGILLTMIVLYVLLRRPNAGDSKTAESTSSSADADSNPTSGVVEEFTITHIGNAGDRATFSDPLFVARTPFVEDDIRVAARFAFPNYCFLFALNPDGVVQLCYPKSEGVVQAEPISQLTFPSDEDLAFGLTDGVGHQAFVLVTSKAPLPSFDDWKSQLPDVNWPDETISGNWVYSGGDMIPRRFADDLEFGYRRGDIRRMKEPTALKDYLNTIGAALKVEVEGVIFEVGSRPVTMQDQGP